ncbi:MAG TPA: glutamate racemase [Longimicrobiales bacterium]|nr:glutamate racemase [Longimicrobiales bacterium]
MSDDRPIGVFDSGIGGLTVVRELIERLPNESLVYFGDTARVPYGPKSPATVVRYSEEAAAFLMSRDVKLIVIACNTATAHAQERLAATLPVPVIGVIEPGARAAVAATTTRRVGVIGTTGTIRSGAYDLAVRRRLSEARVYAQPCPLFVPLVEEGWGGRNAARLIAEEYLLPLKEMDVDVVILGCTHYPLLAELVNDIMGPDVKLVDSAAETALQVSQTLDALSIRRTTAEPPAYSFAASDAPLRFRDVGRTFVGDALRRVEHVDVEGCRLPAAAEPAGD